MTQLQVSHPCYLAPLKRHWLDVDGKLHLESIPQSKCEVYQNQVCRQLCENMQNKSSRYYSMVLRFYIICDGVFPIYQNSYSSFFSHVLHAQEYSVPLQSSEQHTVPIESVIIIPSLAVSLFLRIHHQRIDPSIFYKQSRHLTIAKLFLIHTQLKLHSSLYYEDHTTQTIFLKGISFLLPLFVLFFLNTTLRAVVNSAYY